MPKAEKRRRRKEQVYTGPGRITRVQIAKWNQMAALKFQTGGKTSEALSLPLGLVWRGFGESEVY